MKREIPWDIIISKFENKISPNDEALLSKWLSENENLKLYQEIESVWMVVQKRSKGYQPEVKVYWEKLADKLQLPSAQRKSKLLSFKKLYKYAACVALFLITSISIYWGIQANEEVVSEYKYTAVTGKRQIRLPDGTLIWLHHHTTLTYKSDFKKTNRNVYLNGEAFFEVTKDKKNQFIVHTNTIDVKVYGTKFNVSSRNDEQQVTVSLVSGSVGLTDHETCQRKMLVPGETATYNKQNHNIDINTNEIDINTAWIAPSIQFANRNLSYICEVLSNRYNANIQVDPEVGEKYLYTFTLHDETVDEILELISSIHPISYSIDKNKTIHIKRTK